MGQFSTLGNPYVYLFNFESKGTFSSLKEEFLKGYRFNPNPHCFKSVTKLTASVRKEPISFLNPGPVKHCRGSSGRGALQKRELHSHYHQKLIENYIYMENPLT
jgi:hypothetical protein